MRIGSDDINGHPVPFGYRNYSTLADFIDEQDLNRIMDRYTRVALLVLMMTIILVVMVGGGFKP